MKFLESDLFNLLYSGGTSKFDWFLGLWCGLSFIEKSLRVVIFFSRNFFGDFVSSLALWFGDYLSGLRFVLSILCCDCLLGGILLGDCFSFGNLFGDCFSLY